MTHETTWPPPHGSIRQRWRVPGSQQHLPLAYLAQPEPVATAAHGTHSKSLPGPRRHGHVDHAASELRPAASPTHDQARCRITQPEPSRPQSPSPTSRSSAQAQPHPVTGRRLRGRTVCRSPEQSVNRLTRTERRRWLRPITTRGTSQRLATHELPWSARTQVSTYTATSLAGHPSRSKA